MRNVFVAGAAGGIGEEIVRALVRDPDVRVFAGSRSEARLTELLERGSGCGPGRVVPWVTDLTSVATATASARRAADAAGGFDAIVASLGGWWEGGPLLEIDETTWRDVIDEMLTSHFIFARAFLPELLRRPGGLYVGIGGGAAFAPIRDAALVSIAGAAQVMLTRALAQELRSSDVEIVELVVDAPVSTHKSPSTSDLRAIAASDVGGVVAEYVSSRATSWSKIAKNGPLLVMRPLV